MATSFIGQASLPIGLRNNNPGDLRADGTLWQGMTGSQGGFVTFKDITWGIRAMARDIATSIVKDGDDTINKFISKYAPSSDGNDVQAYINDVSAQTGILPDEQLGVDADTMRSLIKAIMNHELGVQYASMIPDSDIDAGLAMASGSVSTILPAAAIALQNNTGGSTVVLGIAIIAIIAMLSSGRRN